MIRTQIQLSEAQYKALKERIHTEKVSLSAAIREAVDLWLERKERGKAVERSIASLGKFHSGRPDVSSRHDEHLAEIYEDFGEE